MAVLSIGITFKSLLSCKYGDKYFLITEYVLINLSMSNPDLLCKSKIIFVPLSL